jgi:hypothetical protein
MNLQTEFLLQFWKQQEDSALASNRPQQQGQNKKQKGKRKTEGKDNREKL